jgi:hypothetical protein
MVSHENEDSIMYDSRVMTIVDHYKVYHNRDTMIELCSNLADYYGRDETEVVNDVDLLYQQEFGDTYEDA